MDLPSTPDQPQDTGLPDSVERDGAALSAAESLDEDELATDPLEAGVEPPEHWAAADEFGTTPNEQRSGETLDQRLPQEEPDIVPDEDRPVPLADELDYPPEDELDEQ
jgi:hypothetical protein